MQPFFSRSFVRLESVQSHSLRALETDKTRAEMDVPTSNRRSGCNVNVHVVHLTLAPRALLGSGRPRMQMTRRFDHIDDYSMCVVVERHHKEVAPHSWSHRHILAVC